MYMDVAGDYAAINPTVQLVWADYNWVELTYGTQAPATERWVAKDEGW